MIYAFGTHELDDSQLTLRRRGERVRVQPKVFSLLSYLVKHRDRVVPKDELLSTIWPGETLTDSVLARTVASARKALGQQRGERQPIETDYGRGYRFTADVVERETSPHDTSGMQDSQGDADADPFVGRADLLQQLVTNLDAAMAGQGRLLVLSGEPGIGKTRAAEELCARAKAQGAAVWRGRCFDGDGAPALWPFIQVLRACAEEIPEAELQAFCGADRAILAQLVPALGGGGDSEPSIAVGDSEMSAAGQRFHLLTGLGRFLVRAAERTPRVLFLDDLQWADEPSLQVLGFLVQELSSARLLLLCTLREPTLPHEEPARAMLDSVIRPRASERLALSGLSEDDVSAYVEAVSGRPAPQGLAAAVVERTRGNPLFVREALRLLLDETGKLTAAASAPEGFRIELPELALDVIRKRLRDLDAELREALDCAAVFGAEFQFAHLERVLDVDGQALIDTLGDAEALGLIDALPDHVGTYAFTHVLVRDTLYGDLPSRRRVALHRRIGEVMAAVHGKRSEHTGEIAHHFHRALPDREVAQVATDFARRAGDAAMKVYAFDEAAMRYAHALEALEYLPTPDPARRYRLLLLHGQALGMVGQRPRATESFHQALSVARGLGDPELVGWAAYALALVTRVYYASSEAVDAAVQEALAGLPDDDRLLRPRLLMEAAQPAAMMTRPEARRELVQEAIGLLDPADPETPWRSLRARLIATAEPEAIGERMEVLGALVELAGDIGQEWIELDAKRTRYPLYIELGDIVAADRDLADCRRLANEKRMVMGTWFTQVAALGRAQAEGRLKDLERLLPQAVRDGQTLHTPAAELLQRVHETWLALSRGQTEHLNRRSMDLERDFAWTGQSARIGTMRMLLHLNRLDDARSIYEHFAAAGFENVPINEYVVTSLIGLAEVAYALRDRKGGKQLQARLRPLADRVGIDALYIIEGTARGALGLLSALEHDYQSAVEHLELSVAVLDRMGLHALAATDRLNLARALLRRGEAGDRGRADALGDEVATAAPELGLLALGADARDLKPL